MGRRIRIPALLDILIVDSAREIRAMADDPNLVRSPPTYGRLINRYILGNLFRALATPDQPLPSALPKDDKRRQTDQRRLFETLQPDGSAWDEASLRAIADYLHGRTTREAGVLSQEAIGRLFVPDYRASHATWRAAELLDEAVRSLNPVKRLLWRVTGAIGKAQRTLSEPVGGNPQAVHATGIAVHSFTRSVEKLRKALADPVVRRTQTARAIVGGALTAPDTVVRRSVHHTNTAAGPVNAGTLVLLRTGPATARESDPRVAFLADSWSACPAHHIVPAMLAEIWRLATGESVHRPSGQPTASVHSAAQASDSGTSTSVKTDTAAQVSDTTSTDDVSINDTEIA